MDINLKKLRENVADELLKAGLTNANQILRLTENELQSIGSFTVEDVTDIFYVASEKIISSCLVQKEPRLISVGCPVIDALFDGGLRCGGINELSGESGCGKTQFCLRLALIAQNPLLVGGIDKSVLYICTEHNFPSKRLVELIHNIRPPFKCVRDLPYGDHIYVEHIPNVKGLQDCLYKRLPKFLETGTVGLLILDSITALFRSEYTLSDGLQRTKDLRSIGCQFHALSKRYNLCILCVNQVTAAVNDTMNDSVPALGLAWANLVTTRILMRKNPLNGTRTIEIVFSPHTKSSTCSYVINEYGIQGLK